MSVAIQWGYPNNSSVVPLTQGFIYFDAVTTKRKTLSGSVSKNPIDGGGNIADHFTRENPVVTFSGVISGVDISSKYKLMQDRDGNTPTNVKSSAPSVKVNSGNNPFLDLLPASVGQFFRPTSPSIVMASQRADTLEAIQLQLESLFADGQVQLVTLFEYQGNNLKRQPIHDLVMTNLTFEENPDTGKALEVSVTLEQVSFVTNKKTNIPKNISEALVAQDLKTKAATLNDKGKGDSTVNEGIPPKARSDLVRGIRAAGNVIQDISGRNN